MQEINNFMVKVTVQNLIDALNRVEDKEKCIVLSTECENFYYLQSIYELTDSLEKDTTVIALISGIDYPPSEFNPKEITL